MRPLARIIADSQKRDTEPAGSPPDHLIAF